MSHLLAVRIAWNQLGERLVLVDGKHPRVHGGVCAGHGPDGNVRRGLAGLPEAGELLKEHLRRGEMNSSAEKSDHIIILVMNYGKFCNFRRTV